MKSIKKNKIIMMSRIKKNSKQSKGITLIALIITVVVLLILATITIGLITANNGIIKNATEAQILSELSNVKEAIEEYKITEEASRIKAGDYSGEMSEQEMVGKILKSVTINDTCRQIGVIVDLKKLDINGKLGKSGKNLLEESEISESITKETLLDLYDVYAIDFADNSLYYIRDGVWSIDGEKVDYELEDGTIKKVYAIETQDKEYIERRKFITNWKVANGEEVVLPTPSWGQATYDCTIEWGDGETTTIQHNITVDSVKITKTTEELKALATHTYQTDGANDIREIKISGIYSNFDPGSFLTAEQRSKLTGIKQWGNVEFKTVTFGNCTNLEEELPNPNTNGLFSEVSGLTYLFYGCSKLSGNIPENLFEYATNVTSFSNSFYGCSSLTGQIPEKLFANCPNVTSFQSCFYGCSNLEGQIPENLFANCPNVTIFNQTFFRCKNLESISEGLFRNNTLATDFQSTFNGCTSITSIPEKLFYNNVNVVSFGSGNNDWGGTFVGCSSIQEIPENLFANCTKVESFSATFSDCSSIKTIPANLFKNCTNVKSFAATFTRCSSIQEIPEGLFNTCTQTETFYATFNGTNIAQIPENLFTNNKEATNFSQTFRNTKITKVPANLFKENNKVTDMAGTFAQCSSLIEVEEGFQIPESVTTIGGKGMEYGIFSECSKLSKIPTNFIIGENITDIGYAFNGCFLLEGSILIKTNTENYTRIFYRTSALSSNTLIINYTSNCTNIDDIIATAVNWNSEKIESVQKGTQM